MDECHAIGAPAAVAAVNRAAVRRWVGLSATPYRADQMDALITMQCGPVRHEIADQTTFTKHLTVHPTAFTTEETGDDGVSFQALYGELAADEERNARIAADIADAARRGRHSLALSNRLEHLDRLAEALHHHGIHPMLLHGRLSAAERAEVRAALDSQDTGPTVLLAIDKVAGEGFDAARLDCLFLTSPFRFKGKSIQHPRRCDCVDLRPATPCRRDEAGTAAFRRSWSRGTAPDDPRPNCPTRHWPRCAPRSLTSPDEIFGKGRMHEAD
ncbi:hypothetical protein OHB29_07435 [Streptomyces violaceus]|uniref:Helicase C-terminal domain-containing protein n=1 Tax=Streptomyces violaceus TaxID=1936 RepID=A0ABZ1NMB9_STRVL